MRDLYQVCVYAAYVRGSVIIRHVDDRPHHLSAEEGDGSAQNGRSVIYDRIITDSIAPSSSLPVFNLLRDRF